jgi:DNA-binding NarL/FixJ family response regulator
MSRPSIALIVDDEPHVRVYLKMLLRQLGVATIWESGDAEKGLVLVEQYKPQVILLDVNMPGRNGLLLMAELNERHPEIPVIVVTSQMALKTVQDMHDLGAFAYLLKHTPRDQMLKMLGEALDSVG